MHMYSPAKLPAPTGLPAALPLQPPHATPISARLSMLREGDRVVYFVHTDPVCSHTADHKLERNLCLARFALFGGVLTALPSLLQAGLLRHLETS